MLLKREWARFYRAAGVLILQNPSHAVTNAAWAGKGGCLPVRALSSFGDTWQVERLDGSKMIGIKRRLAISRQVARVNAVQSI